jgi:hypothetical protein
VGLWVFGSSRAGPVRVLSFITCVSRTFFVLPTSRGSSLPPFSRVASAARFDDKGIAPCLPRSITIHHEFR